jgi:hypothetical protein
MTITLWLCWTLLAGQPVDVNSFMTEDQCHANLAEATDMLKAAKAQHPGVPDFTFVGCIPVVVVMPAGV